MSKDLLKKLGLGLVALLVVFNTYNIHGMKKHSNKSRAQLSGMKARMGNSLQKQRPAAAAHGQRSRGNRSDWSKNKKQQKPEAE